MSKLTEIFNFDHIGKKIKNLAQWSCWVSIVLLWLAIIVVTLGYIAQMPEIIVAAILAALVGPVIIWISCWPLYGFGELIDKVTDIEDNTYFEDDPYESAPISKQEQLNELEMLREKGLITEEVYEAQRAEILSKL